MYIIIACCMFTSCNSKKVPAGILPPEKMEPILWQQMKADAFTKEFVSKDSSKDPASENLILQEKIFKQYETDKNTFYKSYRYYLAHEDLMKALLDSVISKEGTGRNRDRDKLHKILKLRQNEQSK